MTLAPVQTYRLGGTLVGRIGFGAMQFTGKRAFGPIKDPANAIAVVREALSRGVDHIDTSDFYGPHNVNRLLREALTGLSSPLMVVTKVGAFTREDGSRVVASDPASLKQAVEDNRRNLGMDVLDVVNLRIMHGRHVPAEGPIEEAFTALADEQRRGRIRHLGLSNATSRQVADARRIAPLVCVQNSYNLAVRRDDALIDALARDGIAYVPYFPLGDLDEEQSRTINRIAHGLSATPAQVSLAWLLQRAKNILPIPGTTSIVHLRENLEARQLHLAPEVLAILEETFPSPSGGQG